MGHLRDVATQIQTEEKAAIRVHCLAHCLNLCLQDAARKCAIVRDALDLIMEISKLIQYSPKRSGIFEQCKHDLAIPGSGLRPLCPTRWTVRTVAIDSVLRNYLALMDALESIGRESHDDYGRRANGILSLQRFDTYFGLKLSLLIFGATEETSKVKILPFKKVFKLQTWQRHTWFDRGMIRLMTLSMLQLLNNLSSTLIIPFYLGIEDHQDVSTVVKLLTSLLHQRNSSKSNIMKSLIFQGGLIKLPWRDHTVNDSSISIPKAINDAYQKDINMKRLERQLQMMQDLVSAYKTSEF